MSGPLFTPHTARHGTAQHRLIEIFDKFEEKIKILSKVDTSGIAYVAAAAPTDAVSRLSER